MEILEKLAGLILVPIAFVGVVILHALGLVLSGFVIAAIAGCFWYGCLLGWSLMTFLWGLLPFALIL